jgi:hypothetical protein
MKIPYPNAFTINGLGMGGRFFPFSVSAQQHESGVATMDICALRIEDIGEVVGKYADNICIVYDVDTQTFTNSEGHWLDFRETIEKLGINCRFYGGKVISVMRPRFDELVHNIGHFNFHMFDLPSEPDDETMTRLHAFATYCDFEEPILNKLEDSRLFLDSHDNCYLYIEARDLSFLKNVFARTLAIYCGTAAKKFLRAPIENVPDLLDPFINSIFPLNFAITILRRNTRVRRGRVKIGFSPEKWKLGSEGEYEPTGQIECDFGRLEWSVSGK